MIEIRIPKEIRAYKEKLFFGLTLRQVICTVLALGINIPLYIFVRPYIGDDMASWLIICNAVPIILVGYFKYNGMEFEKFIVCMFRFQLLTPQKRKYKTENLFGLILDAHQKQVEFETRKESKPKYRILNKKVSMKK